MNEARIQSQLTVRVGNLFYQSQPGAFTANVAGTNGPTPGAVNATVAGVDVNLTQLTKMGGFCRVANLDTTNYVEWGVKAAGIFHPLGELLAGELCVFRLSRKFGGEQVGTGTFSGSGDTMHLKAYGATCVVLVEAFDP